MSRPDKQKFLITSALPYANGPIHFGHIAGAYLPADIYVRFRKLQGHDVVYISGTDEHGVAVTISAEKQGITPREQVDKYYKIIKNTFKQFNIEFDNFSRTSLPVHYKISQDLFKDLFDKGLIKEAVTEQYYCIYDKMFLPDRYLLGTCPECGFENARGDECPKCGTWIDALDLKKPRCSLCEKTPEIKQTKHWFLQLQEIEQDLKDWLSKKNDWKNNVTSFVNALLKDGLKPRPVTRDLGWGIPVPIEEAKGKVLYVWFDAPIGYISSTVEWAEKLGEPEKWKDYWQNPECKLIHFIGKDNIPFHTIMFPAILMKSSENYILPENVPANEFFNYEGKKFSTSGGWYIDLDDFFKKYNTDSIRFSIIANAPENKDTEFTWKGFQISNNSELADSLGNFINRTLIFAVKYFDSEVPIPDNLSDRDKEILSIRSKILEEITGCFEQYKFRKAADLFIELSREGNRYFDEKAPWKTRKDNIQDCANTIYTCIQLTFTLAAIARVIIPESSEKIFRMIGQNEDSSKISWDEGGSFLVKEGSKITSPEVLFRKIDDKEIEEELAKLNDTDQNMENNAEPAKAEITYDDFAKIDFRTGKVLEAEKVEKSDKLIKMLVDLGSEKRQIVGGIGKDYTPELLIGKNVVAVFNLKPRKLMGLESQGMLLAAESENGLSLLCPDKDITPGSPVS